MSDVVIVKFIDLAYILIQVSYCYHCVCIKVHLIQTKELTSSNLLHSKQASTTNSWPFAHIEEFSDWAEKVK